jgi:hypothetical protein
MACLYFQSCQKSAILDKVAVALFLSDNGLIDT